jgi:SAM-dependent methyltransferase
VKTDRVPSPNPNPWNQDVPFSTEGMWLGTEFCRKRINERIAGENIHWLEYVLGRYIMPAVRAAAEPAALRCLILGSNEGWMELRFCASGFTGEIVASDVADKAVARAKAKIAAAGYTNVRHVLADLNRDSFEGSFDFVICEGVLHHIAELERCLRMLDEHLNPGGMILGVEHEAPFRFQLPEAQVRWINAALQVLPTALRPIPRESDRHLPATAEENRSIYFAPPAEAAVRNFDPSEAVSGHAVKRLLPQFFEVVERTGFGGTLLSYMTGHFDFKRADFDEFTRTWLDVLCRIEDAVISTGILEDEFVFYVLRKRGTTA